MLERNLRDLAKLVGYSVAVVILVVLVSLALPAGAGARGKHHHARQTAAPQVIYRSPLYTALAADLQKAHELWGVEPCGGRYSVQLEPWGAGHNEGEASWQTALGPNIYYGDPSTWTDCVLHLNAYWWTGEPERGAGQQLTNWWTHDCTTVLHEWGHLTGHGHYDGQAGTEEQEVMRAFGSDDIARCGR